MFTLCKIRFQYLRKNKFSFAGYLLISIILILYFLPTAIITAHYERKQQKYNYYAMASNIQDNQYKDTFNTNNKELFKDFISNDLDDVPNTVGGSEYKSFNSLKKENFKRQATEDIFIGLVISLEMSILSFYLTERIRDEKELKLIDLLERQGISKIKYILSWVITFFLFTIAPIIGFMCFGGNFFVFRYQYFLINLFLYILSVYSVIIFFLTIIPSLKKGTITINIFNFITVILGASLSAPRTKRFVKLIFCMFPNINIYYTVGVMYIISDGYQQKRTNLNTWVKYISFKESLIFFIVQIIFYNSVSIIIYLYKKLGFKFFLYLRSLCCRNSRNINIESDEHLIEDSVNNNLLNYEVHHQDLTIIEQQNKNENNCLKIVGVTKRFEDLKAINNFSGEFFPNEVFCLLGHKGAGKTTLINLISGLLKPEEGDILLNGESLIINKDLAYKNIGLCQQENIFFEILTVIEHLNFIYDIKGIPRNANEIQDLIHNLDLDLSDAQKKICKDLSVGQKRKLCIGLALLMGGKVLLLDEPTNGMDAKEKIKIWDFLKKYKKEKIIFVTTHSLEEAENLGTRIGIIADGHYICSGTSAYLKTMYPCGINIKLLFNSKNFNESNKNVIFQKIKEYDPKAEIKMSSKCVFSIIIQENNEHITEIFNYIEEIKEKYGIDDYIVVSGSLGDIFLEINKKSNIKEVGYSTKKDENINVLVNRLKPAGFFPQLCSQLYKNILPIGRNIISLIIEYLGAIICGYIFLLFFSDIFRNKDDDDDYYSSIKKSYFISNFEIKSFLKKKVIDDDSERVVIGIILGYFIFLSTLVYEKIKERRTKAKFLLYLSGCNLRSYWAAFFIIDYIKLLIFNVLLLLPIFILTRIGLYLFLCFPLMNLSSLSFIYFFSSFCHNEKFWILFMVLIMILSIAAILILNIFFLFQDNIVRKKYIFTQFDFTPLSSFAFTLYKIIRSNVVHELDYDYADEYPKPAKFCIYGQINQLINCIVYFSLFLLKEGGYLDKWYFNCKSKEDLDLNYVLPEEKGEEEFYNNNNLRNKVLVKQNNNQNISNNNINNNNNLTNNNQSNNLINSNNNIQNNINNQNDINLNFNNINNLENQNENENALLIDTNDARNEQNNINNNIINNNMNNNNQINRLPENNNNILQNNGGNNDNNNPFVRNEIQKLSSQMGLTTKIEGLYKTYFVCCAKKNVRIFNNLNLGLEPNEKFGLLGFNGSGKTSTFRAITNEILFEKGYITLFGNDNKTQFDEISPMIGYCPQESPLFDYMKVREIIAFYIKLTRSTETIESVCSPFDLSKYLDTYCINLSEGNKRKLTLAIALMNKPSLLLLDEPTTGVDPESRRLIWKNLNELSHSGHQYNMILATHSIEEAEILCDRVSWLKKGNFVCIGNPEQLKLQYSNGYEMQIKFVDTVLNKKDASTLTNEMVEEYYSEINNLVKGFTTYSKYILGNPLIMLLIRVLIEVIKEIKPNTKDLKLLSIEKDFTFRIQIGILKEKQHILFSQIFNLKNNNPKISDIRINLESLGDILTSF